MTFTLTKLCTLRYACASVAIMLAASLPVASAEAGTKPNILLIAIDDLNDWVGELGPGSPRVAPTRGYRLGPFQGRKRSKVCLDRIGAMVFLIELPRPSVVTS
jgi:hypothetical protein